MPTRVLISITVKPGSGEQFVDAYRIVRERVATVEGYHEEELLLDETDPDRFLLATLWDSKDAFLTWQQAPVHMEMTGEMHPYFAKRSEIRYYDVEVGPLRSEVTNV
jgi:heme-degrading monooxygenase HmoA